MKNTTDKRHGRSGPSPVSPLRTKRGSAFGWALLRLAKVQEPAPPPGGCPGNSQGSPKRRPGRQRPRAWPRDGGLGDRAWRALGICPKAPLGEAGAPEGRAAAAQGMPSLLWQHCEGGADQSYT